MKSISVIISEYSRHSIELKDEYKLDEFIKLFEKELHLLKTYHLDAPAAGTTKKEAHTPGTSTNVAELTEADC